MRLPPFQQLVDAHWRDVARLAAALAGPGDGEDAAQRAWLRALEAYPRLRSTSNLRGWLLTITARSAMDAHRARRRRPLPVAAVPERAAAGDPPGGDEQGLWDEVRRLPDRQRLALALRYVLDLPHAEVARTLGTTQAASRRLVSDALAVLRRRLPEREVGRSRALAGLRSDEERQRRGATREASASGGEGPPTVSVEEDM
jgi:RNA polymerase sigma factor (sigma-70 family)